MKKCGVMLLICSLPLILSACGNGDNPNPSSGSSASSASSELTSISSDESGFNPGSSSETSTSSIDYTIGWSQDVLDVMEPHLGGHAIPFIDLPGRILATWIEATSTSQGGYVTEPAHLSILSTGGFDRALAGAAKLTYQKAGWDVDFNLADLSMHAEEPTLGIVVDFYGEYDENDDMTNPQIDVFYSEPFIVPTDGSWRRATTEALATIGVVSPHALPYVYLGTRAEEATSGTNYVTIQGLRQGWDQYQTKILAAARAALPRSKKWYETTETLSVPSSSYYSTTVTANCFTKTFSDGYTVKAYLYGTYASGDSSYSSTMTPFLRVTCTH